MTKRATFTQAELDRAMKVAGRHSARVEISAGVIRILAGDAPEALPSSEGDEQTCDEAFGVST